MAGEDSTAGDGRQRARTLKGGLIIIGLVATALLIVFLEDIVQRFERNYSIVAVVPDAPDLAAGSPVAVGGKRVGSVSSVVFRRFDDDSLARVALTLTLPLSVQSQVRGDSRVRLSSETLIGETVVNIVPGSAGAPVLGPGDTLRMRRGLTSAHLMARANEVRANLDTVLASFRALAAPAQLRMQQTQRALSAMDATMLEVNRLQADLQGNAGLALVQDPAFTASLARARQHSAELPLMFAQLQERAGGAGEVGAAFGRLQLRADTLRAQLAAASTLLGESGGFAARIQQDTAIFRALNAARASLDSLMAEARRNPLRFVF